MVITRILNGLAIGAVLFAVTFSTVNSANAQRNPPIRNVNGAPGPIAGAGLPLLAVGYGVYWLIKRRRGRTD